MELVIDELEKQPEHTYVALGKAFVLTDYEVIKKDVREKHDKLESNIKKLEPMDASLEQRVNKTQQKMFTEIKSQQK